jgi:ribosomal protein S27E
MKKIFKKKKVEIKSPLGSEILTDVKDENFKIQYHKKNKIVSFTLTCQNCGEVIVSGLPLSNIIYILRKKSIRVPCNICKKGNTIILSDNMQKNLQKILDSL